MRRPAPRPRALAVDSALALAFVIGGQVEAGANPADGYTATHWWANHLVTLAMTAPLALRRTRPVLALLMVSAGCLLPSLFVEHSLYFWTNLLPLCFVVYPAARLDEGWLGRWSWLIATVSVVSTMLRLPDSRQISNVVFTVIAFGGCALAGRLVRRGVRQGEQLAEALAHLDAEHRLAEQTAVLAERGRIAQEVQDVVAHAVGLMLVQVGAARLGLEGRGHAVPEQLRAAEETGRRALGDLRRSLGVLDPAQAHAPLEPLPDLSGLPDLLRGFQSAGLQVRVDSLLAEAEAADLSTGLQLTVYRLLQEALTNALKHAGRVAVAIRLERAGDRLTVSVTNPVGRPPASALPSGGHGLVGMRERVAMFDGSLDVGRRDQRYVVHATLAVPERATSDPSRPVVVAP